MLEEGRPCSKGGSRAALPSKGLSVLLVEADRCCWPIWEDSREDNCWPICV